MRIISFNANGIRSAASKGFFDWLDGQAADVVCLQETKAQEDQLADPRFHVTRVDIDRPGPTYTVDTLRDLREEFAAEHPGQVADWYFITGADALAEILGWRDPEGVLSAAHLVGVTRPGHVLADPGLPSAEVSLVEVPALAISSTDIRARVRASAPIRYLLPTGVAHLIAKHGLYR